MLPGGIHVVFGFVEFVDFIILTGEGFDDADAFEVFFQNGSDTAVFLLIFLITDGDLLEKDRGGNDDNGTMISVK